MKKIKILHKSFSKPISCLTAYSPSIANILDGKIDLILVGDSIGSTLYGMKNTQGVTMDMMKNHGAAVNKTCLLYTSPSPRDIPLSRMPSSA